MSFIDKKYTWKGYGNGIGDWETQCRLRIYEKPDLHIILFSEWQKEDCLNFSDSVEHISTLIIRNYDLPPNKTHFFESFAYQGYRFTATFSEIVFDLIDKEELHPTLWDIPGRRYGDCRCLLSNPQWLDSSKEEFESLVGEGVND